MGLPFLRIPPFPGHRAGPLASADLADPLDFAAAAELVDLLRKKRVGGSFWGAQPALREGSLVLAPSSPDQAREMIKMARSEERPNRCVMLEPWRGFFGRLAQQMAVLPAAVDPWHVADAAAEVWAGADHELALVAALAKQPVRTVGQGHFADCATSDDELVRAIQLVVGRQAYRCPFTEKQIDSSQAIEMLTEWRRLIDGNRDASAVLGVAAWKRPTVDPLLWDGSSGPRHANQPPPVGKAESRIIVWKSRTSQALLDKLVNSDLQVAEIEDGMIRGLGLGANCVPPLSIIVDASGIYFDPVEPSDLERILETADLDDKLLDRAARLRSRIVELGISKYGEGIERRRPPSAKREILVVGQVEDDRSMLSGGGGQTNLRLLERARSIEPDAWLIYRPHPDVEAGHRRGHIPDHAVLAIADEIERGGSISSLIDAVDEIHCITSLAGFEALLRGKQVTTHGAPFYAGWGLTRDLGQIPARRTRRRSLDELVAATLILYPRYIDPVTRLPCQPEILVERMSRGEASVAAPLSGMRKLQGKLNLAVRRMREAAA